MYVCAYVCMYVCLFFVVCIICAYTFLFMFLLIVLERAREREREREGRERDRKRVCKNMQASMQACLHTLQSACQALKAVCNRHLPFSTCRPSAPFGLMFRVSATIHLEGQTCAGVRHFSSGLWSPTSLSHLLKMRW